MIVLKVPFVVVFATYFVFLFKIVFYVYFFVENITLLSSNNIALVPVIQKCCLASAFFLAHATLRCGGHVTSALL
jgi:hypothetical protein